MIFALRPLFHWVKIKNKGDAKEWQSRVFFKSGFKKTSPGLVTDFGDQKQTPARSSMPLTQRLPLALR